MNTLYIPDWFWIAAFQAAIVFSFAFFVAYGFWRIMWYVAEPFFPDDRRGEVEALRQAVSLLERSHEHLTSDFKRATGKDATDEYSNAQAVEEVWGER